MTGTAQTPTPCETAVPEAYVIAALVQGDWERALELIDELGPAPAYAPHLSSVAVRLLAEKRPPAALRLAARAVELDPECAAAQSVLGRALLEGVGEAGSGPGGGDDAEALLRAESALRAAAGLAPQNLIARVTLAGLCLRQSRFQEASLLVQEALALDSGDPTAREMLKRLGKAVESALKAPDLEPPPAPPGDDGETAKERRRQWEALLSELRRLAAELHQPQGVTRAPRVSLCLITRDEARNLPRVIESVRGLATEIIVVDTGSKDDTIRVAQRLKARVAELPWKDDFAAARNHSLSLATGDWILVLDADDEFCRESVPFLRQWLGREPEAEVVGLYRRYPSPGMQRDSVSIQPRLFRNGRGLRFKGAIHEELVRADGAVAAPDVTLTATIYHHGAIEGPGATVRRRERNGRILLRVLEREPEDWRCRFYLGLTHFEAERWTEAIPAFQAVVDGAAGELDFLPKAYACLGSALLNAHRPFEAEETIRAGLGRFPNHPELWFCLGLVCDHLGRLEEAIAANEAALRGRFGPSLNWHDWACRESKPHLALCDLTLTLGDTEEAARHLAAAERFTGPEPAYALIREAIVRTQEEQARLADERQRALSEAEAAFLAGDPAAGDAFVVSLLADGQTERARRFVEERRDSQRQESWCRIAHGRVLLALGSAGQAIEEFRAARQARPELISAWVGEAAALRSLGRLEDAESCLLKASQQAAEHEELRRALAELYLAWERWEEATRWFQQYLEKNDQDGTGWLGLGQALLRSGNLPAAINCYQRAASLSEGGAAVRVALGEARALLARVPTRSEG